MSNPNKNSQSTLSATLFALTLDRTQAKPLHAQLADGLRTLILSDAVVSGMRLPASRPLAEELSVSRMTVTTAYDQLLSEGYLNARQGGGTFVADHLPHLAPPAPRVTRASNPPQDWLPFQPGLPDQSLFPQRIWARHLERAWGVPDKRLLAQPDPFGWYPLRQAICDHLVAWRGLTCSADQVVITGGAWDAFDIVCRALLEPGARVALEDPGWLPVRNILAGSNIRQAAIPIDDDGLSAADLPGDIAAAIVTPSRHYPTGAVMPLARRLALLDWATQNHALVIEDDYDSEFRYRGQPLPSLSGLDGLRHTIYLGSFSKLLSPAMRIGYMVVPERQLVSIRNYLLPIGSRASLIPQPALAEFMDSGEFATHLRRMRRTYAKRQASLITSLSDVSDFLTVEPDQSGMHLCCRLDPALATQISDKEISSTGAKHRLYLRALSSHSVQPDAEQGLLLGYAAFDEVTLANAALRLSNLFASLQFR